MWLRRQRALIVSGRSSRYFSTREGLATPEVDAVFARKMALSG